MPPSALCVPRGTAAFIRLRSHSLNNPVCDVPYREIPLNGISPSEASVLFRKFFHSIEFFNDAMNIQSGTLLERN
jgi:hypothetical protein